MSDEAVRCELHDTVLSVHLDDGKVNALSHEVLDAVQAALDRAEKEAQAVALLGRPGRFSGGFDLGTMRAGPEAVRGLVTAGGELLIRMLEYPLPIVAGCTGHALAAGALVLLSSDLRIGAAVDAKIGLNEVAIGMTLPLYGTEIPRQRLSKRHFLRATAQAEIYSPEQAVDAGFLDRVVAPDRLEATVHAEAQRLGQLAQPAFRNVKRAAHAELAARLRTTLVENVKKLTGPAS